MLAVVLLSVFYIILLPQCTTLPHLCIPYWLHKHAKPHAKIIHTHQYIRFFHARYKDICALRYRFVSSPYPFSHYKNHLSPSLILSTLLRLLTSFFYTEKPLFLKKKLDIRHLWWIYPQKLCMIIYKISFCFFSQIFFS